MGTHCPTYLPTYLPVRYARFFELRKFASKCEHLSVSLLTAKEDVDGPPPEEAADTPIGLMKSSILYKSRSFACNNRFQLY